MNAVNRLGGLLLGIVLLAAGVVTIVETVALWAWHRPWPLPVLHWRQHLSATQWADRRVLVASIIAVVAGLLVLSAQARRNRPRRLETALNTDEDTWVIQRDSVERRAASATRGIRGVDGAKARASGKQGDWRLAIDATAVGDVVETDYVQQVVRTELRHLGAPEEVPVRVSVKNKASRS